MNINRHNYEAFFLLYVDKELSAPERKAVDDFVSENPDLKMELDTLMQSTLSADTILFDNKTTLLRKEGISSLQQNLLLYLDNELPAEETAATERLISSDHFTKKEFDLLQKTRLQPDQSIIFEDKNSLYRKESGKVIYLTWRRIAIAAILLGFGIWTALTFIKTDNTGKTNDPIAKGNTPAVKQSSQPTPDQPTTSFTPENSVEKTVTASVKPNIQPDIQNNKSSAVKINSSSRIIPEEQNNTMVKKENTKEQKPSNNLPKPLQNFNNNISNQNDVAIVKPENNNSGMKTIVDQANPVIKAEKLDITQPATNAYAINAAYTNNNAAENNEDGLFTLSNEKVKKTKLGGFLRKVKRLVERTANIKTGNGIKVAGFDIAIK